MADPVRCDAWDRLLFGMSLFAGEGFDIYEHHPYRDKPQPSDEERRKAAYDRQVQLVKSNPTYSEEYKQAILDKLESRHKANGHQSIN